MNGLCVLATDYVNEPSDVLRVEAKLSVLRKAFPGSVIRLGLNGSGSRWSEKIGTICQKHEILACTPVEIPTELSKWIGQMETAYLYYLQLLRDFVQSDSQHALFVEADYYPVRQDVETACVEHFGRHPAHMRTQVRPYDKLDWFLGYPDLRSLWADWVGDDRHPLQYPGYSCAFSRHGAEIVVAEADSPPGRRFFGAFAKRRDMPAARWLLEVLFSCLIQKNAGTFCECLESPMTVRNHQEFMDQLASGRYFVHGLGNLETFPGGTKELKAICKFWEQGGSVYA